MGLENGSQQPITGSLGAAVCRLVIVVNGASRTALFTEGRYGRVAGEHAPYLPRHYGCAFFRVCLGRRWVVEGRFFSGPGQGAHLLPCGLAKPYWRISGLGVRALAGSHAPTPEPPAYTTLKGTHESWPRPETRPRLVHDDGAPWLLLLLSGCQLLFQLGHACEQIVHGRGCGR